MKKIMFAAALCIGSAAFAQSATQDAADQNYNTGPVAGSGTAGHTQSNMGDTGSGFSGSTEIDGDASATASGSTSANMGTNSGVGGPLVATPQADYPLCSRTITDRCVQTRNSPRPDGR